MPVSRVDGWNVVTPSEDSRLIYVSNSGNDDQARTAKGRGYYLPSDPEIGPDPTNPIGPIVPYVTVREAVKKLRGTGWVETNSEGQEIVSYAKRGELDTGGGYPDWLMYRRGDTFTREENYQSPGWAMLSGELGLIMTIGWGDNIVPGGAFRYEAGFRSGRSADEPFVIGAWGPISEPRPVIHGGFTVAPQLRNAIVTSLDCQVSPNPLLEGNRQGLNFTNAGDSTYGSWRNVLVEDCRSQGHGMIVISGGGPSVNLTIRRCVWTDGWQPAGHNSSPFNGLKDGSKLTYEECVFDKNGYKENPADATKWTGEYSSALSPGGINGTVEQGEGVQPTRTWFDRNWYMSGDAGDTLVLRGNIASRTGGGAEQMRSGGLAYRNVFLMNHDGLLAGASENDYGVHDTFVVQNLFLHDDVFLPPGGWGMNNHCQGGSAVIAENIYAHPHFRGQNGPGTFFLWNTRNYESNKRVLIGNVLRAQGKLKGYGTQRSLESLDHPIVVIKNNEFAIDEPIGFGYGGISRKTKSDSDIVDENYYFVNPSTKAFTTGYTTSPQIVSKTNKSFEEWKSDGYDTNGQAIEDWNNFKNAVGWTDPDRDIVSYMETIDTNYVPDENVRVDYGTKVQQEVPKLVKDSIRQSGFGGMPNEQDRIITAKRFHAAITFLMRARENRKGKWNDNYTAESLNNYIREGFGKSLVGGEYVLTLSDASSIIENEIPAPTEPPITPEPEPVTPEPEPEPVTPEPEPEPVTPEPEPVTPEPEPVTPEPEPVEPKENNMENDFVSLEVLDNTFINKVTTKTENDLCLVDLYNNDVLVAKIETSLKSKIKVQWEES